MSWVMRCECSWEAKQHECKSQVGQLECTSQAEQHEFTSQVEQHGCRNGASWAYVGSTACHEWWSFFDSLGMRHDGQQAGNNCDPGRYLMSPTLGSGKITWSPCSRRYLDVFLRWDPTHSYHHLKKYQQIKFRSGCQVTTSNTMLDGFFFLSTRAFLRIIFSTKIGVYTIVKIMELLFS